MADNETFGWQAVGWRPAQSSTGKGWIPEKLGEGLVTLGAKTLGTAGIFIEAAASFWADTITETSTNQASRVYSPANDEVAVLAIGITGYTYITIQVSTNGQTAATMNVITQVADSIGGALAQIEIDDTGLATAALQTTGNTALGQIEAAIEKIDHLIAANSGNKDAGTQRVVLATDDIPTKLTTDSLGATDVAVATAGGVGSISAKLRNATALLGTIDADTGSILAGLHSPANQTAMGAVTATTSWDADTSEMSITANSHFVHVSLDEDTYIICNSLTADPSTDPAWYRGGDTHKIPCRGQTKLHYKSVTTGGDVTVTAFHN